MRSLKVLSAGSTLYGMKPAADTFTRETGIKPEMVYVAPNDRRAG